jgi:hypothetical protein
MLIYIYNLSKDTFLQFSDIIEGKKTSARAGMLSDSEIAQKSSARCDWERRCVNFRSTIKITIHHFQTQSLIDGSSS